MMDSDAAASVLPSGKIRRCSCGRRMGGLGHDFHTVGAICRGIDSDADHRCPECTNVTDAVMSNCVAHKLSLQRKLQHKRSRKDPVPAAERLRSNPPMLQPSLLLQNLRLHLFLLQLPRFPVFVWLIILRMLEVILCVRLSLFDSFAQLFEVRFSNIDNRFSQVLSGTSSVAIQDEHVSQDVLTPSFTAPTVVAGCAEPTPDRASSARCRVILGTTLGGPAATVSPTGDSSPSRLSLTNLMVTLRVLE